MLAVESGRSAATPSSLSTSNSAHITAASFTSSDRHSFRFAVDLVAAARCHLSFLRSLPDSLSSSQISSIRRYSDLWMPLVAEYSTPAMLLPAPDVRWIWHCHLLDSESYRSFCASRFGFVIDRPAIFDDENEEYAVDRCRQIWKMRYPSEPFDLDERGCGSGCSDDGDLPRELHLLLETVSRYCSIKQYFSDLFLSENVYLVAARRRYLEFLKLVRGFSGDCVRFAPASDILLMWLTHQSFPGRYEKDRDMVSVLSNKYVVGFGEAATEEEKEATSKAWEELFDEPYEHAGAVFNPSSSPARLLMKWSLEGEDVNSKYKGLQLRNIFEVRVYLKGQWEESKNAKASESFLRVRTIRCHRELKLDCNPIAVAVSSYETSWRKAWHLFLEFATRGISLELRRPRPAACLAGDKLLKKTVFLWNDVLRSTSLTLKRDLGFGLRALCSITPPVQGPYLLKCVPDRVTDDGGAMISDVMLARRSYRPQEGRWLTRTALDHAGRECFVVRNRVGRGFWRRGAETPSLVSWEERVIEVREGSWSYVAGSVGTAPQIVAATATPKRSASHDKRTIWCLSTGYVLTIDFDDGLMRFQIENENPDSETMELMRGRRLQYEVETEAVGVRKLEDEEENYLTLVRRSHQHPSTGRATALLNWKLMAVEFLPEEDAAAVLLLCTAVLRTASEFRRTDVGGLTSRRRVKEVVVGARDWGSVMLPPSSSFVLTPYAQSWYLNAEEVLASSSSDVVVGGRNFNQRFFFPADGKESMYRMSIFP